MARPCGKAACSTGATRPKTFPWLLTGSKCFCLTVGDAGDDINYDHGDWADAKIVMAEGKPEAVAPVREPAVVLTPKASPKPRINGARVVGVRPGSPFLFTVPATGEGP